VISGDVPIFGTATIDPFQKYELHFKQDPSGDDAFHLLCRRHFADGRRAAWRVAGGWLATGTYTLRFARRQGGRQLRRKVSSQT
jgi:hypothetical protein